MSAVAVASTGAGIGAARDGIIRRHDRPDSAYLALGARYPALAHINLPTKSGARDGEGTLIGRHWILTAAHVAQEVRLGHRIEVGGKFFTVDSIVIHPAWTRGPHDLALLRLSFPVMDVAPVPLYRGDDEQGREVILLGYGDIGTGQTGPTGNDGLVRGATNRIDEAAGFWLKFAFDPPGSPNVTDLEGVSGPGDSGGPAFFEIDDRVILAGVSSAQSSRASGGRPGHYGVIEYYVRVSRYLDWIDYYVNTR